MSYHKCHAINCNVKTHPSMLMCLDHWEKVPDGIKKTIIKEFNPDQCRGFVRPTGKYLKAARLAIMAIKEIEK